MKTSPLPPGTIVRTDANTGHEANVDNLANVVEDAGQINSDELIFKTIYTKNMVFLEVFLSKLLKKVSKIFPAGQSVKRQTKIRISCGRGQPVTVTYVSFDTALSRNHD